MTEIKVKIGEHGQYFCKLPCGGITPHEVIRPISTDRIYVSCLVCSSVSSFPKYQLMKAQT